MQVWLRDMNQTIKLNGLEEVSNPISFDKGMQPTPDGLFSNEIFGMSVTQRKNTYAYINLVNHYINPKAYIALKAVNRNFEKVVYGTDTFKVNTEGELIQDPNGDTGIEWLYSVWNKLKFKKTYSNIRSERVDVLTTNKKDVIFTTTLLVMPAFYRDVNLQNTSGRTKVPEINDKYNGIIRNVRMIQAGNNFDFMIYSLQGKTQDLILEIYNMLKVKIEKKQGYIRKSLMAKSVDYGLRVVITNTAYHAQDVYHQYINTERSGVPLSYCLSMFTPFIIWWVRNYFKTRLEDVANQFPVIDRKTGDRNYVRLKDPALMYTEDNIQKQINRWINDTGSRFDKIELEVDPDDAKKYKIDRPVNLTFVGYPQSDTSSTMNRTEDGIQRPLTWTDVFYMAAVDVTEGKHIKITRYPMLDYLGTMFTKIFVMSTRHTMPMIVNDQLYPTYPVVDVNATGNLDSYFIDSLKICPVYLGGLDGDFDGDQVSAIGIYSDEANEEAERKMYQKQNAITIDGKIIRGLGNEAIQTLYTLTRRK